MAEQTGAEEMLTFADGAGNLYQIPRAVFEQGRVPDDQKQQLQQALDETDTQGFALNLSFVGVSTYAFKQGWPIKY